MKLSFTTAGCPGWSWNEIFAITKDIGFDGVEIRGVGDELYAPSIPEFGGDQLEKTKARLAEANLTVPVLDSTCALAVDAVKEAAMIEAKAYINLAEKLGAPYVRVMPTEKAHPTHADLELCKQQYEAVCEYGAAKGVTPIMETNGVLADSAMMRRFMDGVESENKGVLWDVHHPYRFFDETPETTFQNLASLVKHVHVKDSLKINGEIKYKMMGYGDVPVMQAMDELKKSGYDGFISLEWLKRWNPDLQEPGIVFAHYKSYMDFILSQTPAE